jgi:DNA-binding PadR family transcriptional regulator
MTCRVFEWTTSETGRKVREYRITPTGRKRLATEAAEYRRTSEAIVGVVEGI